MRDRVQDWFKSSDPERDRADYAVQIIEPKLKLARNYRKRLQEPLRKCRLHCRALVAEIPGPIRLRRNSSHSDPFVKAAFTRPEHLEQLLTQTDLSPPAASLPGSDRVALLTMSSRERTIFGRKQMGINYELRLKTLTGLGKNPNLGGVIIVGLHRPSAMDLAEIISASGKPVECIVFQELGSTLVCLEHGVRTAVKFVKQCSETGRRQGYRLQRPVPGRSCHNRYVGLDHHHLLFFSST